MESAILLGAVAVIFLLVFAKLHPVEDPENFSMDVASKFKSKRIGVIGAIGGVLTFIGEFMPCVSMRAFSFNISSMTFYEGIRMELGSFQAFLVVLYPVIIIAAYLNAKHFIGMILSLIPGGILIYGMVTDGLETINDSVEIGFWIILLGLILGVVSPFLKELNEDIVARLKRK